MATASRTKKAPRPVQAPVLPRYEPVLELPPLPPEQYEALRDNIALNGVLVPILVDGDGPVRRIIDGNNRRRIADELGYDCPEIIKDGLTEGEKRTLARALNLARRQLTHEQRRQLVADQLRETPGGRIAGSPASWASTMRRWPPCGRTWRELVRLSSWSGRSVPTASPGPRPANPLATGPSPVPASSRADLTPGTGRIEDQVRPQAHVVRPPHKGRAQGPDRRHDPDPRGLPGGVEGVPSGSVDAVITDPIYPEVRREYGRITEPSGTT